MYSASQSFVFRYTGELPACIETRTIVTLTRIIRTVNQFVLKLTFTGQKL